MKSITFDTKTMKALLENDLTQIIQSIPQRIVDEYLELNRNLQMPTHWNSAPVDEETFFKQRCPYQIGEVLYVKEDFYNDNDNRYMYRADYSENEKFYRAGSEVLIHWSKADCMPEEATRCLLRINDIKMKKLADTTEALIPQNNFVWVIEFAGFKRKNKTILHLKER